MLKELLLNKETVSVNVKVNKRMVLDKKARQAADQKVVD